MTMQQPEGGLQPWKRRLLSETTHLPSQLWQAPILVRLANKRLDAQCATQAQRSKVSLPTDPESVELLRKIRSRINMSSYRQMSTTGAPDWRALFTKYDRDRSGLLEYTEIRDAVRTDMKISPSDISEPDIRWLFKILDEDGSGSVTITELLAFLHTTEKQLTRPRKEVTDAGVRRKLIGAAVKNNLDWGDWRGIFQRYDAQGSGSIKLGELRMAMRRDVKLSQWDLSETELRHLFTRLEEEGAGGVTATALVDFLKQEDEEKSVEVMAPRRRKQPAWARPWLLERGLNTDSQWENWMSGTSGIHAGRKCCSLVDLNRHSSRKTRPSSRFAVNDATPYEEQRWNPARFV